MLINDYSSQHSVVGTGPALCCCGPYEACWVSQQLPMLLCCTDGLSCVVCADVAKGAVDKAVSSATSATKALPTKGLSTPSVPRAAKKVFTPPTTSKKDIGINASK